jgi:N-acetylneuraminate synthase
MVEKLPYLIAEIGVNHENNLDTAITMIEQAHEAGASAVKFQSYKTETLASKNSPAYWDTTKEKAKSQYRLFKRYDRFGKEEFERLSLVCRDVGIDF